MKGFPELIELRNNLEWKRYHGGAGELGDLIELVDILASQFASLGIEEKSGQLKEYLSTFKEDLEKKLYYGRSMIIEDLIRLIDILDAKFSLLELARETEKQKLAEKKAKEEEAKFQSARVLAQALNIRVESKGYEYLIEAVTLVKSEGNKSALRAKDVYKQVGEKYGKDPKYVEMIIRTLIAASFNGKNRETWEQILGPIACNIPPTKRFIWRLAELCE